MSWASIILTGLNLLSSLMNYFNEKNLIKQGEDKAIAKASLLLLEMTEEGKNIRERINKLSDSESEELWDRMTK